MKKITSRSLGFFAVVSLSCLPLSAEDIKTKRVTPPPAAAEATEQAATPETEVKQVRKLTSSQPDPSLVLELEEEDTSAPKKLTTKAPPKRPVAQPSTGPTKAPASLNTSGKPTLKLGGRLSAEIQSGPEVAIILVGKQFFPSRIRLKDGLPTRLYLTTTNERPAAVVVEQMKIQRWIAKEGGQPKAQTELERAKFEVRREVAAQRVTEIVMEPMRGTYSFHDVISGAKGQITVE